MFKAAAEAGLPASHTIVIATSSWQHGLAVPTHFKALADELVERGHRVILLIDRHAHEMYAPTANPAVHIWPSLRPTGLADARFAYRLLAEQRPSVLIANFGAVNVMALAGWLRGIPVRLAWYHTLQEQLQIDNKRPGWLRRMQAWRKRLFFHFITHFVPVSKAAQTDLSTSFGIPAAQCRVLYNPLHDPYAEFQRETAATPVTPLQLFCVGRFDPVKGQDILLRAFHKLHAEFPQLRLVLAGDGPLRGACERLAQDLGIAAVCDFLGNISHDEVLQQIQRAAICIVPSRSDNCPLTVIEALACGKPLVAAQVGGIPELLDDGIEGFLVEPDDPAALAERLARILRDETLRQRLGANARKRFLARYEMTQAVKSEADWLETLARHATS
jgi:glycosyltransferase involved in cell wall biosynthesis